MNEQKKGIVKEVFRNYKKKCMCKKITLFSKHQKIDRHTAMMLKRGRQPLFKYLKKLLINFFVN